MIHIYLVILPVLLGLAALFAASEASLFSLSRPQLEGMKGDRPWLHRLVRRLLSRPEELLSTLVIGNECLNILIGTFVVALLELYWRDATERQVAFAAILISSFLLLVFSEILPKVFAFRLPVLVSSLLAQPMDWVHFILTPFRKIFLFVSHQILGVLRIRPPMPEVINEQELRTLVEISAEAGSLETEEKQMIYNVFDFSDRPVSSVMTQWKDVLTLTEDLKIPDILSRVRERTFSRVPVLSSRDNQVVGVLYTKELLHFLLAPDKVEADIALRCAIFPPYIISGHKKISALFREFKLKKIHIALVVDEWGKNLGVVTLEDLLNALFITQRKSQQNLGVIR